MLSKRSIALPRHVSLAQVADASRDAVRAFLELDATKPTLAAWLRGPYREATRFGPRRMVTPPSEGNTEPRGAIVAAAQAEVTAAVRMALAARATEDLVRKLPPVVHIVPAHDTSGARGFVPIDAQGGRLADRVIALVLADYLTRPRDFVARPVLAEDVRPPHKRAVAQNAPTQPQMPAVRRK